MSFTAKLSADIVDFEKGIKTATESINQLQKNVDARLNTIGKTFEGIGKRATVLSVALVAAGGKAYSMAADFQDAVGATEQVFKDASNAVKNWADNLGSQYGIAKSEALEYSNTMGSMLKNIGGLTEEQSAKQASTLIELAGDLTAMFGGSTQDAVRALTGALKGNNTMLDNYGMAVNDALVKSKAFEMGLISQGQELSLQAKQAATLSLIWEQTADAQGQAAREADGASGTMRSLRVEIENLSTELGEVLLPIITPIVSGIRDFVSSIRSLSPEIQSAVVGVAGISAAIGPVLIGLGKLLQVLPAIKVAVAALTGPVGLAVAAIAGAVVLVVKNWDKIKEYFTSGGGAATFRSLQNMATTVKVKVVEGFQKIKELVSVIWEKFGTYITGTFQGVTKALMGYLDLFMNYIKNGAEMLTALFNGDWKGVLEGLKNMFKDIFMDIGKIMLNQISAMSNYLAGFFDAIGLYKWAASVKTFADKISVAVAETTRVNDAVKTYFKAQKDALAANEDALSAEIAAADAKNRGIDTTKGATSATKDLADATTNATNTINNLADSQKYLQGSDISEVIKRAAEKLNGYKESLEKLRSGEMVVTNVHKAISVTEEKINSLKSAIDTLTGNSITKGTDVFQILERNRREIEQIETELSKLKTSKIGGKGVYDDIETLTEKLTKLKQVQDALTGGSDYVSNIKPITGLDAWRNSDMFKNMPTVVVPGIDTSLVEAGMGKFKDISKELEGMARSFNETVTASISGGMQKLIEGAMSVEGVNVGSVVGALLSPFGDLAIQLGEIAIATGIGIGAIRKAFESLNPVVAITAGAALIALGATIKGAVSSLSSSSLGSSSNYSGGTSSYDRSTSLGASDYRGAYSDDFVVTFVQKGSDLVGVLDTAQQKRNRI